MEIFEAAARDACDRGLRGTLSNAFQRGNAHHRKIPGKLRTNTRPSELTGEGGAHPPKRRFPSFSQPAHTLYSTESFHESVSTTSVRRP